MKLLDLIIIDICNSNKVPKLFQNYKLKSTNIEKFIYFYYFLTPIKKKKDSYHQFILYILHLLQSYLTILNFEKQNIEKNLLEEFKKKTLEFIHSLSQKLLKYKENNKEIIILLKIMEYSIQHLII